MLAETPRAMVERHIIEGELRIARLERIIQKLDRDGHLEAAKLARETLEIMEKSHRLSFVHLQAIVNDDKMMEAKRRASQNRAADAFPSRYSH
jgi:hypothetical protein